MPNPLVAGAGGSIASSAYSAYAANKGTKAQIEAGDRASALEQQSADKQLALQREIWEKQQADYKPYLEQGTYGINRLGDLMRNRTPIGDPSTPFYNYTAANQPVASQQTQQTPQLPTKQPNTTNWLSGAGSAGGLSFGLDGAN